jgi:hypothetical protein
MSATDTPTLDLDGLERDTNAKLAELRGRQQRLALPALTDPEAAAELATVQDEIGSAQRALEQVALARVQQRHLDEEALLDEAQARSDAHTARAVELQTVVEKSAAEFDKLLGQALAALKGHNDARFEQLQELSAAQGRVQKEAFPNAVQGAVVYAMRAAGISTLERLGGIDLGPFPPKHPAPLAARPALDLSPVPRERVPVRKREKAREEAAAQAFEAEQAALGDGAVVEVAPGITQRKLSH